MGGKPLCRTAETRQRRKPILPRIASLYIHIPFCRSKCYYCDFFSRAVRVGNAGNNNSKDNNSKDDIALIDKYLEALKRDISYQLEARSNQFKIEYVPTVYIGGGTPSVLSGEQLSDLLDFLKNALPPAGAEGRELSIEANSESLSAGFLQAARQGLGEGGDCDCVEGGGKSVTRLSVGVQTLDDDCRRMIGRLGSSKHITENLSLLKGALKGAGVGGFELSFDLISGLPGQGKDILRDSITKLLEYNPVHISLYDLTLEPGTPLEKMYRAKVFNFDEGQNAELWLYGRDMLEQAGFNWYEVSNFAKPGKESRHNLRYWTMKNWLGAGCGASGTLIDDETGTALRRTVTRDIESYISHCNAGDVGACFETEHISRKDLLTETLMMGFRLASGPFPEDSDEALFKKRFSISLGEAIPNTISKWQNLSLYRRDKNALTDQGRLFLNSFLLDALGEAAAGALTCFRNMYTI